MLKEVILFKALAPAVQCLLLVSLTVNQSMGGTAPCLTLGLDTLVQL